MAYDFNGTNQHITASRPDSISAEPITLSVMFWDDSNTTSDGLLSISSSTNDRAVAGLNAWGHQANDPLAADKYADNAAYGSSTIVGFVINKWFQGAGVFASTTSRTAYLDGTAGTTNTTSVGTTTTALIRLAAGSGVAGAASRFLNGRLAEAAIWNVALNADEITSLAKGFKPNRIRPQSLVFYAPLIRDLQDVKSALTLTNNNSATVIEHPRVY